MRKFAVLVSLLSGSLVLGDVAETKKALDGAKISHKDAATTALKEVAGAKLAEIELDWDNNAPQYEVEVLAGDQMKEVVIDGVSGKVLRVESDVKPDDKDDKRDLEQLKKALAGATHSFGQAHDAISKESKNARVVKLELEMHSGKPAYEVKALDGDKLVTMYVDAASGKVTR